MNLFDQRPESSFFSVHSQATVSGIYSEEIIPIEVRGTVISEDDTVRRGVTLEKLSQLKPVFEWGDQRTTAGNASGIGDGAGICIMTTRERADAEGWEVSRPVFVWGVSEGKNNGGNNEQGF